MAHSDYSPRRQVWKWFNPLGRGLGMWAYVLNRVTGLALVFYLYLHLAVLSLLSRGQSSWDPFIALARSPAFLTLDVILIAAVLIHALNGKRITLLGLGIGMRVHKQLFLGLMALALLGVVVSATKIYGWW